MFNEITKFAVIIAMIIAGPAVSIWALNTVFALSIPLTVETWFAMFWIHFLFVADREISVGKK